MTGPAALLWRAAGTLAAPLLPFYLRRRARAGREIAERLAERRGVAGGPRPPGRLLWIHAASVGETLSVLRLMDALAARLPDLAFLVTTGTVTSAGLLAQRLPAALAPRLLHRFVPLDVPAWTARFLDSWRPDAGVFVESELWPNLIAAAHARGIPLALVNARLSARSARLWGRGAPGLARALLGGFRLVLAQSQADAERLAALGAPRAACWGNLKYAADPLPADPAELERLRRLTAGREILLAASTHPGEEVLALVAHQRLAALYPRLLTILVPRHPQRGEAVALEADGLVGRDAEAPRLRVARRAAGQEPGPGTVVYVADTLGELGLFYRLASVALVGGSLVRHGGQNPLEPARLGCPILLGPHTWNFAEPVARLVAAGGAVQLAPGADLATALAREAAAVLRDPHRARAMTAAAAAVAADQAGLPARMAEALAEALLLSPRPSSVATESGPVPAAQERERD
ncbi:3-deoxy-D-manno-octulosonic acid transferase [Caldovatus aquaticus]|uniref:3-deoxy-D-manno-octulosonic acid transferase n=1 Tax=Caldovatus aquaticus TaxID=2865671 RepID=A0ABS7F208_9PROT|nr:3-deoxy-D-manno-octulosonic acid transferase [Caldovatus aquaticus]MBW8269652.1 3-deoxy-D-manno-octulosonic acid transferase [Caldovatus aquaticus]